LGPDEESEMCWILSIALRLALASLGPLRASGPAEALVPLEPLVVEDEALGSADRLVPSRPNRIADVRVRGRAAMR